MSDVKPAIEIYKSSEPDRSGSEDGSSTIGLPSYQRVAVAIRQAIIDGSLEDGRRITTMELAQKYGVSLAPVREALLQLSAEGIVSLPPRRGAIVRAVTADFLAEIYEVRLGLIPYLEGERAAKASPVDIAKMTSIEDLFEKAASRRSTVDMIRHNIEFHTVIMNISVNQQAKQILARHRLLLAALRERYGYNVSHRARTINEHRQLIDAYRESSVEGAREISRKHLKNSFEEILEVMNDRSVSPRSRARQH